MNGCACASDPRLMDLVLGHCHRSVRRTGLQLTSRVRVAEREAMRRRWSMVLK